VSKNKYTETFSKVRDYDEQADFVKKEFMPKFTKSDMFELMWSYRTVIKYLCYEIIHKDEKELANKLLKACEEVAVLSARERSEKDGKVKNLRKKLEKKDD
jgi:hypothetical protein